MFDSRGLLCGVVTTTHESKDLSFAVYADAVHDMLTHPLALPGLSEVVVAKEDSARARYHPS